MYKGKIDKLINEINKIARLKRISYKLENENMREYYLRCALYENRIPLELLVKWHKSTVNFIKENLNEIIYELRSIKINFNC